MLIKLFSNYASPTRNIREGTIVDFPEDKAMILVNSGQAEMIETRTAVQPTTKRKAVMPKVKRE